MVNLVDGRIRQLETQQLPLPDRKSFDGADHLTSSILMDSPPWAGIPLTPSTIPGMISPDERRYYSYIGRFYSGQGAVVELGPWLGCSTFYIVQGLLTNPHFADRKLYVYDDFIWRAAWMDPAVSESDRLPNHADFRPLFDRYTAPIRDYLITDSRRIIPYDGNDAVSPLTWDNGLVEIVYADCGRTYAVNDAWWTILAPHFIIDRTLVIMQDWGTHRETPVKWYNQTKQFIESRGAALQLTHELKRGGIATFLYRGGLTT